MQINVCIFGVSGYTGAQLIQFLAKHKFVNITGIFGYETIGQKIRNLFPSITNLPDLTISNYSDFNFDNVDLIFSCLPHGKFQSSIINNIKGNNSIIDLSGDFRLDDLSLYEEFYGNEVTVPLSIKTDAVVFSPVTASQISGTRPLTRKVSFRSCDWSF